MVAGHTGGVGDEQATLLAYDGLEDQERWRYQDMGFDGSRTLLRAVLSGSDGRIYGMGTYFPSADPEGTLLMTFSQAGEALDRHVSDEVNGAALAEAGGRMYVFGERFGKPIILPFDDVGGPGIGPALPPGFERAIPQVFWPLPDGWLLVMDIRGPGVAPDQPFAMTWVVRVDHEGTIVWDKQYADPVSLGAEFRSATLAGDQLHLLFRAEADRGGPPDRQVALTLDGGCRVAPRLVFSE